GVGAGGEPGAAVAGAASMRWGGGAAEAPALRRPPTAVSTLRWKLLSLSWPLFMHLRRWTGRHETQAREKQRLLEGKNGALPAAGGQAGAAGAGAAAERRRHRRRACHPPLLSLRWKLLL